MEGACKRILEKKGVRHAEAKLNIEENTFTFQGQSDDSRTISSICDIITHAFPRIQVNNEVRLNARNHAAGKSLIAGVSSGEVPYIIHEVVEHLEIAVKGAISIAKAYEPDQGDSSERSEADLFTP